MAKLYKKNNLRILQNYKDEYRRKGIGNALMTEIEQRAIENDCYQIFLITHNDRLEAIAFYESLGFNPNTHKGFKKPLKYKNTNQSSK